MGQSDLPAETPMDYDGLAVQASVRLAGRLSVRAGYQAFDQGVPYYVEVVGEARTVQTTPRDIRRETYEQTFSGSVKQHGVETLLTVRALSLLGNHLDLGAGGFARLGALSVGEVAAPSLTYEGPQGTATYTKVIASEVRADAMRGLVGMVSLTTDIASRVAFVTQFRYYRPLGRPSASLAITGDEALTVDLRPKGLWTSGLEVALF